MPVINVPELNAQLTFPDTMSDKDIGAAIQKEIAVKAGKMASEGVGPMEAFLIGAGRTTDKVLGGAKQALYGITGQKDKQAALAETQAYNDAAYKPLAQARPISTGLGETLPYFAVPTGAVGGATSAALRTVPGAARLATAAATPLADAMLTGALLNSVQYTPEGESRLGNAAIGAAGGAAGYGIGKVIGKAITPFRSNLTPAQQQAAATGEAMGLRLTPGQKTGNTALQKVEASLESFPPTSGAMARINDNNQSILRRTAARAIGENADDLGTRTLDAAEQRIGDVYNRVADATSVNLPQNQMINSLAKIEQSTAGLLQRPLADHPLVKTAINQVANGTATREELQSLGSKLGKAANKEMRTPMGDRDLGSALFDVKNVVDDALLSSLSGAKAKEFGDARAQYRTLMQLIQNSKVVNESSGNVNAQSLASVLAKTDRKGYTFGRNQSDLYNAARFSEAFPKAVADSGTATRNFLPWVFSGGGAGVGAGIGAMVGNPVLGGLLGLASVPAANVAARAYTSPLVTKYLANQKLSAAEQQALARYLSGLGMAPAGLLAAQE